MKDKNKVLTITCYVLIAAIAATLLWGLVKGKHVFKDNYDDELAIYLDYIITDRQEVSNADFFLNMLRSYRQIRHNSHRWIFCSSISIESFLERHGLSKSINDAGNFFGT